MPGRYDISKANNDPVRRGDAYKLGIRFKGTDGNPMDLTGYTFRMQARDHPNAAHAVLTLDQDDNPHHGLTLVPGEGLLYVAIGSENTQTLKAPWRGVYDIEGTDPSGERVTFLQGNFEVEPDVTRT